MPSDSQALGRPATPLWRKLLPLIGLLVLVWIVSRLDLSQVRHAVTGFSPAAILLAVIAFCFNLGVKSIRWFRMLRTQGLAVPANVAFAAFFNGQFYGQVTVGRLGEFYRAEALVERRVPVGTALSSCLLDRALDLTIVVLVGSVLGAFVVGNRQAAIAAVVMVGLPILAGAVPMLLRPEAFAQWMRQAAGRVGGSLGKVFATVSDMIDGTRPLLRLRPLGEALLWSVLAWCGYFAALWLLADGMRLAVSPLLLVAGAALAALSSLIPLTISGLGARELIYIQVLGMGSVAAEDAVVLSLVHLAVMTFSAIGLGLLGMIARERQRVTEVESGGAS